LFFIQERRAAAPLLRFGLLKTPGFSNSVAASMMTTLCQTGNSFMMPFFLVTLQGRSEAASGLILLTTSATMTVMSPVGGWLADRYEARWVATAGLLISMTGYLLLSRSSVSWSQWDVVGRIFLLAIGSGLFQSPNSSSAFAFVSTGDRGAASGTMAFMRNFGFSLGTALAGSIWTLQRAHRATTLGLDPSSIQAQLAGMQDTYVVLAGLLVVAVLASVSRPRRQSQQGQKTEPMKALEVSVET
jgi:MFS family permease